VCVCTVMLYSSSYCRLIRSKQKQATPGQRRASAAATARAGIETRPKKDNMRVEVAPILVRPHQAGAIELSTSLDRAGADAAGEPCCSPGQAGAGAGAGAGAAALTYPTAFALLYSPTLTRAHTRTHTFFRFCQADPAGKSTHFLAP